MKTVTKIIEVYEFKELTNDAKMQAITDYINFMLENLNYNEMSENMRKSVDQAEHMKTSWFTSSYVYENCSDEILEIVNEYGYLKDGSIYIDKRMGGWII